MCKFRPCALFSSNNHNWTTITTTTNHNLTTTTTNINLTTTTTNDHPTTTMIGGIESVTHRSAECLVDTQQEAQALRQTDLQKNIITTIPPTTTNTSQLHPIILDSIPNMSNSLPNLLAPLADFGGWSYSRFITFNFKDED